MNLELPTPKKKTAPKKDHFQRKEEWKNANRYQPGEQNHLPTLVLTKNNTLEGLSLAWA